MIVYKIRRKGGLFSKGGSWPCFNDKGKIWKRRSDLTSHLNQLNSRRSEVYAETDIVEFEIEEREVQSYPLTSYLMDVLDRKALKEQARQQHREIAERKLRERQYQKLKKEFADE